MSVRFDADTDRISYSGSLPDPATAITATGWVYISTSTGNPTTFFRLWNAGGSTVATVACNSAGVVNPGYFTAGGQAFISTSLSVGAWYRIAITCTGTSGIFYLAPAVGATTSGSGTVAGGATPTGITVGGRGPSDASESFDGREAYVRVWSSVLTQAEIEAEWASVTPVITSGLVADWPLLVHTDLTDHSGNGRDLVAGATAVTTEADPPIAPAGVAVIGRSAAGATSTTNARKAAVVTARAGVGASSSTGARKAGVTASRSTAGGAALGTPRKAAASRGSASSAALGSALARKAATSRGLAAGGAAALSTARKAATVAGRSATGASSSSTARKAATVAATTAAGVAATRSGLIARAVVAALSAGAGVSALVRRTAATAAITGAGGTPTATPKHVSVTRGLLAAGAAARTAARKLARVVGLTPAGLTVRHVAPSTRPVYKRLRTGTPEVLGELHAGPHTIR